MKDSMRFQLGWGYAMVILGISVLAHAYLGNLGISLAVFLVGTGIGTLLLGYRNPRMPLIVILGAVMILSGGGLFMVTSALVNPLFIVGCLIIFLGAGYLVYATRPGGA
jgi:hypothetical protein